MERDIVRCARNMFDFKKISRIRHEEDGEKILSIYLMMLSFMNTGKKDNNTYSFTPDLTDMDDVLSMLFQCSKEEFRHAVKVLENYGMITELEVNNTSEEEKNFNCNSDTGYSY